jgi:CTP:phosphocholine cytidylyltransferase-like protein
MTQRISICPHCRDTYPDFDVAHVCSRGPYAPKLKLKKNERIRELAEQAGYTKDMFGVGHWDMPECKKFAELIVEEMLRTCEEHPGWTGRMIGELIKEHFGVEE